MHRLMIVDDSNIIRNKIERSSEHSQFEIVAKATNGAEAIELFKKERPTLVTMDLTMPEMDGLECIRSLTTLDENVRILVVSALADKATGLKALKYGARGFVCKPFTEEGLLSALQKVINA